MTASSMYVDASVIVSLLGMTLVFSLQWALSLIKIILVLGALICTALMK
jgi:hypothetical protein